MCVQRQRTALHIACEKGSVEVVDKLLEMNSDVHHVDKVNSCVSLSCYLLISLLLMEHRQGRSCDFRLGDDRFVNQITYRWANKH